MIHAITRTLSLLSFIFWSTVTFSQDQVVDELQALSDKDQYDQIIKHAPKSGEYSAKALYLIGMAYYMKEDDANCLDFMDRSIKKSSGDPAPFFIKGSTLNYMEKYTEAITCFDAAIQLEPGDPRLYSGLGDAYYYLEKPELALQAYQQATELEGCPDRPYSFIAQIYADREESDKALEAYYVARSKIDKRTDSYINALFNIGLYEYLKGNNEPAEAAFVELLQINPADYNSYAKLIQVYYRQKKYEQAKPLKDKLYTAHKKGVLTGNLKDMFCFDQFQWNDKFIRAYERYEEGSEELYNKHLFYVLDKDDQIEFRIQTEFSPVAFEMGTAKYLLCQTKGETHSTFNVGFNDDYKYDDLKKYVLMILAGELKPSATSGPGK